MHSLSLSLSMSLCLSLSLALSLSDIGRPYSQKLLQTIANQAQHEGRGQACKGMHKCSGVGKPDADSDGNYARR